MMVGMLGNVAADRQRQVPFLTAAALAVGLRPGVGRAAARPGPRGTGGRIAGDPPRLRAGPGRARAAAAVLAPRARPSGGPGPTGACCVRLRAPGRALARARGRRAGPAGCCRSQHGPPEADDMVGRHGFPAARLRQIRATGAGGCAAAPGRRDSAAIAAAKAPASRGGTSRPLPSRMLAALVSVAITAMPAAMPSSTTLGMASVTAGSTMMPLSAEQGRELGAPELASESHLRLEPERAALVLEARPLRPVAGDGQPEARVGWAPADARPRADSPRPCARSGGRRRPSPCRHGSARGGRSSASTPLGRMPIVASGAVTCAMARRLRADREHTGGVAPDPARDVAQQQRVEQPQAAIVARHVRAAQRDDVGLPVAQPPADQAGREARPAVAQVERLLAPATRARGATAPTIQRTSSSGCQRLRSRLPTGRRWRSSRPPGRPRASRRCRSRSRRCAGRAAAPACACTCEQATPVPPPIGGIS